MPMPSDESRIRRFLAGCSVCETAKLGRNFDLPVLVVGAAKPRRQERSAPLHEPKLLQRRRGSDILYRTDNADDAYQLRAIAQDGRGNDVDADQRLARRLV